jgi:hypothetical protein
MENSEAGYPVFSPKRFVYISLIPNLVFLLSIVICLFVCKKAYADGTASRTHFLANLAMLVFAAVYSVLVAIFSMRRFSRKHYLAGAFFILQFFATAFLTYWLYLILGLFGFGYALKG